jgi:hypothetical protein
MSNCETFHLNAISVERTYLGDILRAVFHTILFNRALGLVVPREVESALLDLTWVQCGDARVDQIVEDRIQRVLEFARGGSQTEVLVTLSFYETRKQHAWFGAQEKHLYWEQWKLPLSIVGSESVPNTTTLDSTKPAVEGERQRDKIEAAVEVLLSRVIENLNRRRDHIPPVVAEQSLTYPFDITVQPLHGKGSSFGIDIVRRVLSSTQPPSVLH